MAEIDILVPVLGRPQNAQPLVDSIKQATTIPHEIVFLCSPGDEEQIAACRATGERVEVTSWPPTHSDYPKKMNWGYTLTTSPWLLLAADDLDFEPGWDTIALGQSAHYGIIGTNDCANKHFRDGKNSTHPLVRRSYVDIFGGSADGPGVLIHEGYDHNFCERELNGLAQHRDLYLYISEVKIHHQHPLFSKTAQDATYHKGAQKFRLDQQLFFSRSWRWDYRGLGNQEKAVAMRFRKK